jgi:hypothetical protein
MMRYRPGIGKPTALAMTTMIRAVPHIVAPTLRGGAQSGKKRAQETRERLPHRG